MVRVSRNTRITVNKSGRQIIRSHQGTNFLRATLTDSVPCISVMMIRRSTEGDQPICQVSVPDDLPEGNREFVAPAHGQL